MKMKFYYDFSGLTIKVRNRGMHENVEFGGLGGL